MSWCTFSSTVNSLHNYTCSSRVVFMIFFFTNTQQKKLPVGVSVYEALDKVLTEPVSPVWVDQGRSTTLRVSHIRTDQGLKNVLIQTCMSDFMYPPWKAPGSRSFMSLWRLWLPALQAILISSYRRWGQVACHGISFVVKKVRCDSMGSLTPPGLVLM
jgi:hypothetical protein